MSDNFDLDVAGRMRRYLGDADLPEPDPVKPPTLGSSIGKDWADLGNAEQTRILAAWVAALHDVVRDSR